MARIATRRSRRRIHDDMEQSEEQEQDSDRSEEREAVAVGDGSALEGEEIPNEEQAAGW